MFLLSPVVCCSSLITDVKAHYKDPTLPYPSEESALLQEVTSYLETAGISDPLTKVTTQTDTLAKRQTDRWTDRRIDEQADNRQTDGWTDRQARGQTDGQTDR